MRSLAVVPLALAAMVVPFTSRAAQECGPTPYDCAAFQVSRGEFTAALPLLERVLAESPTNLKALNLAGIALTGAGRSEEANARFRDAIRLDPRFFPALKNLAINEFNAGRLDDAAHHFDEVLKLAPDDEVTHLHIAEISLQRGNSEAALFHYEKSRGRIVQNPAWILHYARALLEQHQTGKAVSALDRLPDADAENRFQAGLILGRAGAHPEAARFFASAGAGYRDPYAVGYNETLMRVEAGDYDGAVRVAQRLIDAGLKPAELYNLVARAHLKAGRIKESYDALRTAIEIAPAVEENYIDLATICLDHQNFDLGLEIVDIGLVQRPDSALLHLQRGVMLAMRAELSQAETEFDRARRLAPDLPAPYAGLAMIWMQTGQTGRAVDVLRSEARQRRDHVVPYMFAVVLLRSGLDPAGPESKEAVDALHASITANARFAPARSELGRLLLKRDDLDGAVTELEQAIALDPENTAAIYNLAQAYRKKGDRTRAADLLARVSALNAQERGDDPAAELKRTVTRIVREAR
jgi:tetratricopeptide (TPR) repeat protein